MSATQRRGASVLEVVMLVAIAAFMILPVMQLSSSNASDSQEILERTVAQGMCLDTLERLKNYPIDWPAPGETRPGIAPVPSDLMFPAYREQRRSTSAFQDVFDEQLKALKYAGFQATPLRKSMNDPFRPGLFELKVTVEWTSLKGAHREVTMSRMCYAHRTLFKPGGKPGPP